MAERSGGVTNRLLERLHNGQAKRAEREKKLSFTKKLRIVDQLMADRMAALARRKARL